MLRPTNTCSEYRSYNRIQPTAQRGWDQYLPQAPAAQSPVPVVGVAAADVAVAAGQAQQQVASGLQRVDYTSHVSMHTPTQSTPHPMYEYTILVRGRVLVHSSRHVLVHSTRSVSGSSLAY